MEKVDLSKDIKKEKKQNPAAATMRMTPQAQRALDALVDRVNKKDYGKKVKVSDVILKIVAAVSSEQIREMQESSYQSEDRLAIQYKEHLKKGGKLSEAEFLDAIMNSSTFLEQNFKT